MDNGHTVFFVFDLYKECMHICTLVSEAASMACCAEVDFILDERSRTKRELGLFTLPLPKHLSQHEVTLYIYMYQRVGRLST